MSVERRYALLKHDHGLGSPDAFDVSAPANGEVLQYNDTTGKWENAAAAAGTTVYKGSVTSVGNGTLPSGLNWSSSRTGVGQYRVTHNLGTSSYVLVANIDAGSVGTVARVDRLPNWVNVYTYSLSGVLADRNFLFILVP